MSQTLSPGPLRLHHHATVTDDQEANRRFYEEVIGVPLVATWTEIDELFGGDAFPYGFEQNLATLEALTEYSYRQGLTPRRFTPGELFAVETHDHPGDNLGHHHPRLR